MSGESVTFIDYGLLIGLGAALGTFWLATMFIIRRAFPSYGWLSSETLTFFTTLFDFVSDIVFVTLLFRTSYSDLKIVAVVCLLMTMISDASVIAFVVYRERASNSNFAQWLRENRIAAATISLCSLGNTESFTMVTLGYTKPSRWTNNSNNSENVSSPKQTRIGDGVMSSKFVVPWVTAPMTRPSVGILRRWAWLSFALDDIALFAIQLVVNGRARLSEQMGNILVGCIAISALSLVNWLFINSSDHKPQHQDSRPFLVVNGRARLPEQMGNILAGCIAISALSLVTRVALAGGRSYAAQMSSRKCSRGSCAQAHTRATNITPPQRRKIDKKVRFLLPDAHETAESTTHELQAYLPQHMKITEVSYSEDQSLSRKPSAPRAPAPADPSSRRSSTSTPAPMLNGRVFRQERKRSAPPAPQHSAPAAPLQQRPPHGGPPTKKLPLWPPRSKSAGASPPEYRRDSIQSAPASPPRQSPFGSAPGTPRLPPLRKKSAPPLPPRRSPRAHSPRSPFAKSDTGSTTSSTLTVPGVIGSRPTRPPPSPRGRALGGALPRQAHTDNQDRVRAVSSSQRSSPAQRSPFSSNTAPVSRVFPPGEPPHSPPPRSPSSTASSRPAAYSDSSRSARGGTTSKTPTPRKPLPSPPAPKPGVRLPPAMQQAHRRSEPGKLLKLPPNLAQSRRHSDDDTDPSSRNGASMTAPSATRSNGPPQRPPPVPTRIKLSLPNRSSNTSQSPVSRSPRSVPSSPARRPPPAGRAFKAHRKSAPPLPPPLQGSAPAAQTTPSLSVTLPNAPPDCTGDNQHVSSLSPRRRSPRAFPPPPAKALPVPGQVHRRSAAPAPASPNYSSAPRHVSQEQRRSAPAQDDQSSRARSPPGAPVSRVGHRRSVPGPRSDAPPAGQPSSVPAGGQTPRVVLHPKGPLPPLPPLPSKHGKVKPPPRLTGTGTTPTSLSVGLSSLSGRRRSAPLAHDASSKHRVKLQGRVDYKLSPQNGPEPSNGGASAMSRRTARTPSPQRGLQLPSNRNNTPAGRDPPSDVAGGMPPRRTARTPSPQGGRPLPASPNLAPAGRDPPNGVAGGMPPRRTARTPSPQKGFGRHTAPAGRHKPIPDFNLVTSHSPTPLQSNGSVPGDRQSGRPGGGSHANGRPATPNATNAQIQYDSSLRRKTYNRVVYR